MKKYANLHKFIVPVLIFFISFTFYKDKTNNLNSVFYWDEYPWISRTYYLDLVINRDLENDLWNVYEIDKDPKLTQYIYGLFLYPDYLKVKRNKGKNYDMVRYLIDNNFYDRQFLNDISKLRYDKYLDKNFVNWGPEKDTGKPLNYLLREYGKKFEKTINVILKARLGAVFFLSLSVVLAYVISQSIFKNTILSVLVSFLYGTSSLVVFFGTKAQTESLFLFFINLAILTIIKLFSGNKFKKRYLLLIALSLIIALTNQVKLIGILLILIFFFLSFLTLALKEKNLWFRIKKLILENFLVVFFFVFFYILLDPFLYKNPAKNICYQYQLSHEMAKDQQRIYGGLSNIKERASYINSQFLGTFNYLLQPYSSYYGYRVSVPLFLYGVLLKFLIILGLVRISWRQYLSKKPTLETLIIIIFLLFYASLLYYLHVGWNRYLVHLVFFIYIIVGQGLVYIFDIIKYSGVPFKLWYKK